MLFGHRNGLVLDQVLVVGHVLGAEVQLVFHHHIGIWDMRQRVDLLRILDQLSLSQCLLLYEKCLGRLGMELGTGADA